MNLSIYKFSELQNFISILEQFNAIKITDARVICATISAHISVGKNVYVQPAGKRRPDNLIKCLRCGNSAMIIPVNSGPGDKIAGEFTHAIQCQNRPATDQPWLAGMCGHTEYLVRGER